MRDIERLGRSAVSVLKQFDKRFDSLERIFALERGFELVDEELSVVWIVDERADKGTSTFNVRCTFRTACSVSLAATWHRWLPRKESRRGFALADTLPSFPHMSRSIFGFAG
jgi:hypothetical protein